jgi:acyl carrier protein
MGARWGETANRVTDIIAAHLGVSKRDVLPDVLLRPKDTKNSVLGEDLGCDSLDIVELVMAIEDEFAIEISDDDAATLNTASFGSMVDFVHARLGVAGSPPSHT